MHEARGADRYVVAGALGFVDAVAFVFTRLAAQNRVSLLRRCVVFAGRRGGGGYRRPPQKRKWAAVGATLPLMVLLVLLVVMVAVVVGSGIDGY